LFRQELAFENFHHHEDLEFVYALFLLEPRVLTLWVCASLNNSTLSRSSGSKTQERGSGCNLEPGVRFQTSDGIDGNVGSQQILYGVGGTGRGDQLYRKEAT
jgi:hypothetical protein